MVFLAAFVTSLNDLGLISRVILVPSPDFILRDLNEKNARYHQNLIKISQNFSLS